ncbi:L-lactate MFS transporter [Konateibacter massiliensis]|uniref:L-lactate MFS transporter n=1 Tax=Konateibacter massiliensis TaxID=2002841 RepID=UPI000C15E952|nr:OFA family MFS transporter [Konateibacter massiliensis]
MKLKQKRWLILVISCLINLCIGSLYAWSVFASPMADYINGIKGLSLNAGSMAIVFTIANSVGPITMISGGSINDRFGPKFVIFAGGILFGGGMLLSGFAQSVGFLILTYGIFMGLGMGLVYGCTINNSVKFFPDKRGLIGGIATATYGLSSVIMPFIANALIQNVGITMTFKIIGVVFLVVICAGAFFIEKCPADYVPEGWTPKQASETKKSSADKNWREMLADKQFYVMLVILTCGAFCGLMFTSQASAIGQNMVGMSVTAATTAVSVLALFNATGRIASGYISDRIGRINMLAIAFVIALAGLGTLYMTGNGDVAKFYVGISAVGFCFGSFMGIFPGFTADQFGTRNNSVNYGIMFIGFAFAGFFGPTLMKQIYTRDAAYQNAFLAAIGISAVGLLLTFVFRAMNKKVE